jgi:hypothetical protein
MAGSDDALETSLMDLAFARGRAGAGADDKFVRGRIAMLLWLPGALSVVLLAREVHSWIVGVVGIVLLLVGLWIFAERGDLVAAYVRGRFRKIRRRLSNRGA